MGGRARAKKPAGKSSRARPAAKKTTSYDQLKEFDGKRYTGMKVGRRHAWRYDQGEWSQ